MPHSHEEEQRLIDHITELFCLPEDKHNGYSCIMTVMGKVFGEEDIETCFSGTVGEFKELVLRVVRSELQKRGVL